MRLKAALAIIAALWCAACSGNQHQRTGGITDRRDPEGHVARLLAKHPRRRAKRRRQELGVDIAWRGPLREDDRDSQVAEVENAVARGVAGIVLAPLDDAALVGAGQRAMRQKIPVVIFDSGLKGDDYVSFVATDNEVGGRLGGEQLAKLARRPKGRVILLRYAEGQRQHHASARKDSWRRCARTRASRSSARISTRGADVEGAYKKRRSDPEPAQDRRTAASPSTASSAPNESSSFGMMRVLQDNGWAGKVKFVGFDASRRTSSRGFATATSTGSSSRIR